MLSREEREEKIKAAHYNLFGLDSADVYIDLLTDSGTGAMSVNQWSALMRADESYAGASSFYRLRDAGQALFGYGYIQPVHQGRAAEKVLMPVYLEKGKFAISNMFFDTTRAHVELAGARAVDCVTPLAREPRTRAKFKGNMDVPRLAEIIKEKGPGNIGVVVMTVTNNSAGGVPVSMRNIKEVSEICKKYKIPYMLDAARFAENAYFIKRDEEGFADTPIIDIVREMFSYADVFVMSSKKDGIVNIGGLIGVKDENSDIIRQIKANVISYEGFYTYGGLSGRDLEALAVGLYEGIDEDYLRYRIGQMEYLAARLDGAGIAYQSPVGGHGVFIDASDMFPDVPCNQFPAHTLALELYKEAGVRSCDVGSYMLGNDPDTGSQLKAEFEFTRLAIPRRVYTKSHIDLVADALIRIKERSGSIKSGYKIVWEPPVLRHFQARLAPV